MTSRHRIFALLAFSAAPFLVHAQAKDYPNRPITLIVPWTAGGSTDVVMRAVATAAARKIGQPFVVENKPGVAGTLGPATMAATAKPDGYTIAQVSIPLFRLPLIQKVTWNPEKDFTYIVNLMGYTYGITAGAQTPFTTWGDVVAYAKKNPGRLSYGSPGQSTTAHLGMEQIAALDGIEFVHVPFKSSPESNVALVGGHTDLQVDGAGWKPIVESGKARLLAVWTDKRTKRWPDVPTLKELGYPLVIDAPIGVAGPRGMDPKIAAKLHDAFRAALDDPEVQRVMADFEMVPNYLGPVEYRKYLLEQQAREKVLVKRLGLAIEK
ncbi:tripartite tricarboxylate transporter substrate binding protein [Ramlibacter sp. WS9]|uniref:tripartite tricarboxylate transporter substrate binding protein n=1 Tax=Ramlibacter sp. WS9 TaxID=1882741 RepID=UPI001144D46A|nr:tripartite tricarboxylate transporter substrate binding protein [Ramlibacter sp. WS9]ROZ76680.1 tripartite tricarboxylate transporter substrate binding protein [Ramlibacter sp. WS9]